MQEIITGLGCFTPILVVVIIWLIACIRVINKYKNGR